MADDRKYKRTPACIALIVAALEHGTTRTAAAAAGGISLQTLSRWMDDDDDFVEAVTQAEGIAQQTITQALFDLAKDKGDVRAMELWLRKRCKEDWGDSSDPLSVKKDKREEEKHTIEMRSNKAALAAQLHAAKEGNLPIDPDEVG